MSHRRLDLDLALRLPLWLRLRDPNAGQRVRDHEGHGVGRDRHVRRVDGGHHERVGAVGDESRIPSERIGSRGEHGSDCAAVQREPHGRGAQVPPHRPHLVRALSCGAIVRGPDRDSRYGDGPRRRRSWRRGSLQHPGGRRCDGGEIGTDVFAIGAGVPVRAGRQEAIVAAGAVHEADRVQRCREEVVRRVVRSDAAGLNVATEHEPREERIQGVEAHRGAAARHALVLRRDVVGEREAGGGGRVVRDDDGTDLESGVVIDRDVGRPVEDLEEPRVIGGRGGDVVEHVVANQETPGLLGDGVVVEPEDVHAGAHVADDVVGEGDVLDDGPGRGATIVADREHDPETDLRGRPHVLEDVAVDEHALGILDLDEVLDDPWNAGVAGVVGVPRQGFGEVVAPDLDVRGHEVRDGRTGASEQKILGRPLQVVVDELGGAGTVPHRDGLRVAAFRVEVGEVGVDDRGGRAVGGETPHHVAGRGAMNVTAVERDVVGQLVERRRRNANGIVPEQNEVRVVAEPAGPGGSDLDADEPVVVRAELGGEGRHGIGTDDRRHERGMRRVHAGSRRRQSGYGRGANVDPLCARLGAQNEVPGEGGPGLELNDVAGLSPIEGSLEVAAVRDGDDLAARRRVGGVDEH